MGKAVQVLATVLIAIICPGAVFGSITQDVRNQSITIADDHGDLELRLKYNGRCLLDRVVVKGQSVVPETTGVSSAIKVGNRRTFRGNS